MLSRNQQTSLIAFAIGAVATIAVVVLYRAGVLDWLEYRTLDLRFRSEWINSIPFSDELVSIDIDDRSLELVGRWPWPRDVQEALIRIPAECGARALLVDLAWNEPEPPRPAGNSNHLLQSAVASNDAVPREMIYPDQILRGAIARAGNVYPAFHNYHQAQLERTPAFAKAVQLLLENKKEAAEKAFSEIPDAETVSPTPLERATIAAAILREPAADAAMIAETTGIALEHVRACFGRTREVAYRILLRSWLEADESRYQMPPAEILATMYAYVRGEPLTSTTQTPQLAALSTALSEVLSVHATVRPSLIDEATAQRIAQPVRAIGPVHFPLAEKSARPGFVNFSPSTADGVMRKETLFEQYGDALTSQLAFTVGWDMLQIRSDAVTVIGGDNEKRLIIEQASDAELKIQLDERGRAMVPWVPITRVPLTPDRFIPASLFVDIREKENAIAANNAALRASAATLLSLPSFEANSELQAAHQETINTKEAFSAAKTATDRKTYYNARATHESAHNQLAATTTNALNKSLETATLNENDAAAYAGERDYVAELARANDSLRSDIATLREQLRIKLDGKICLIGYTATALADMKPTPVSGSMPGVRAHLNMINGMLTGRMVSWMPLWLVSVWTVVTGLLMSLLSTVHRQRAFWWLLLSVAFVLVIAAFLFHRDVYWLPIVPLVGALTASYAAIALFQYSFVDRERRALTKTLGQYTSKTLARKMAEQPELCLKAESREVTAMFTDLAGFTSISEEIGAERTQRVLNVSLGGLTEVMIRHEAMINKFIGDGVFVFWNPVIHPQEDHARRACETALELFDELDRIAAEKSETDGDPIFARLQLRVGIATGNAVVGPCGSEQKYDYTCIGDSVNVAARLESANKFYGTRILVSGPTRDAVGADFEFRTLGAVRVKGKTKAVPIYELIGKVNAVDEPTLQYALAFSDAVRAFQACEWSDALRRFEACSAQRPTDRAATVYCEATKAFQETAPEPDWNGALALVEK